MAVAGSQSQAGKEIGYKRILALDGGGIRGVFSLEVLLRMQELLRQQLNKPEMVLADHFDMFAGTSTGAIMASCLCWGMPVEKVMELYVEHGPKMFQLIPWYNPYKRYLVSRHEAKPLSDMLRRIFSEDGEGREPALLDSKRLKKPLWKAVRASTAAPVFFDPEEIVLANRLEVLVDGAITPYNNPALIAALTAVLRCYRIEWEPGPDKVRLISIGTIRFSISAMGTSQREMWLGYNVPRIPAILIQGVALQQDYLCRCLGECLYGEEIDAEVGNLIGSTLPGRSWFSYVRYNKSYVGQIAEVVLKEHPNLEKIDAIRLLPLLRKLGREYALESVRVEHLI